MANTATFTQAELEQCSDHELAQLATASNGGVPITYHNFTALYRTLPNVSSMVYSDSEAFDDWRLGFYDAERKLIKAYTFPKGTSKERAITIVFLMTNG